ncbi:DUF551 domain-containing protein [Citrobacter freundii]|uniref:DUF551 domain-containing protein n=1 Tax=Citrobacter freundii TaxID=546 RepID=A0ABY7KZU4_CITFR|nr:DUF551 domain-containing protein [Citrobacter freundii]WAZ56371.1 DUF551 domain-containing protein [Citrobacter freundii]WBS46504.1 DUF551 domain-containing protein [Citrobacter freundii]
MSTITRELAKLFRKITNSEIDAEGNAHVVLSPADSLLINNARIALASLEAEASGRNPVLAYADSYRNMANHGVESIPVWSVITDLERNIAPLFTAPPAPVSVPDEMEMDDDFDSAFEHGKAVGWNACRAAMLQGAEPVSNRDELPVWVACSERMPPPKTGVVVGCWFGRNWATKWATYLPYHPDAHQSGFLMPGGSWTPTHWMPLPAAPQQEVTQALAKGMERYGDAMQKLADSGD